MRKKIKLETERINDKIRATEVRCVGDNIPANDTHGIMYLNKVKELADELSLDVVEISPNANPVVVKIMDYTKFIYEKKQKLKSQKSTKTVVKGIRFTPNIGVSDLERKISEAKEFLEKGFKVKITSKAHGRKFEHMKDEATKIALDMVIKLNDVASVEVIPSFKGKNLTGILKPKK